MQPETCLRRLTDRNASSFFGDESQPYVLLLESRYDPYVENMIEALRLALERIKADVIGAVCVIEDAPAVCKRFDMRGAPTVVAGLGETVLGKSFGTRSEEEIVSLIEKWLSIEAVQGGQSGSEVGVPREAGSTTSVRKPWRQAPCNRSSK
ncbi:MAG: hypothetical protein ABIH23_29380 [bacterium]